MKAHRNTSRQGNIFTFLSLFFGALGCFGQTNPLDVKIIPPSPDAASIGKFIDVPVSQYTGIPKIEVPIYQLKSFELTLPISLNYHASGIKVEEIPSWVGAGWAMSAGGIVSRTIRGLNDEHSDYGYFSQSAYNFGSVDKFFTSTNTVDNNYFLQNVNGGVNCTLAPTDAYQNILYASRGGLDLEPDLFFFELPDGQSGKFVYDRDKTIHMLPQQYSNITYSNYVNGNLFKTFTIIGKDGTKYEFEATETTQTEQTCNELVALENEMVVDISEVQAPSTWKISRIESASGKDWIEFDYEEEFQVYTQTISETVSDGMVGFTYLPPPAPSNCNNITSIQAQRLAAIRTKAGYNVVFKAGTARSGMSGGEALDEIVVLYDSDTIKSFNLNYSGSLLTSVRERVGVETFPPYTFTYDGGPHTATAAMDHWGYYNGALENTTRIPAVIYNNQYFVGADREADLESCREGTLTTVTYPTGGTTELQYELNDYANIPVNGVIRYTPGLEFVSSIVFSVTNTAITYSESKTFTLDSTTHLVFLYDIPEIVGGAIDPAKCGSTITKSGYSKSFLHPSAANPMIETLGAGTYTFAAVFDPDAYTFDGNEFYVRVYRVRYMNELLQNNSLKGGGLRVKSITNNGDQTITKTYSYKIPGSSTSSGKLMAFPSYGLIRGGNDGTWNAGGGFCETSINTSFLGRASYSNAPLSVNQGSHVGYDVVTEYLGTVDDNNGYSVHRFTNFPDEEAGLTIPVKPTTNFSYKNGLLLSKTDYTTDDRLVKETINTYYFSGVTEVAVGIRIAETISTGCYFCTSRTFGRAIYGNVSEKVELQATQTLTYGTKFDIAESSSVSYVYNGYDQVSDMEQKGALPGKPLKTHIDYHSTNHTAVTNKYSYYLNAPGSYLYKSAEATTYDATYLKPSAIDLMETSSVGSTSYPAAPTALRLAYSQFDAQGNVLSYSKTSDPAPTSLVWNARKLFPIAQVLNATPSEIAYSSFEAENEGGWTYAGTIVTGSSNVRTGRKAINLTSGGQVNTDNKDLVVGTYVVSWWSKDSNGSLDVPSGLGAATITTYAPPVTEGSWTLYTRKVVVTSANTELRVSGNTILDDLRLHPIDAQMSTYTFDPVVGMTSATDQNNYTSYYKYDKLHRLKYIVDFEGNILKRFEYHYQLDND
ncbi:hypothetical protein BH09BAC3_BH09BAC3_25460 [soil metagenome]